MHFLYLKSYLTVNVFLSTGRKSPGVHYDPPKTPAVPSPSLSRESASLSNTVIPL